MWNIFEVNNKEPERRQWCRSGVFIFNFEHISFNFIFHTSLNNEDKHNPTKQTFVITVAFGIKKIFTWGIDFREGGLMTLYKWRIFKGCLESFCLLWYGWSWEWMICIKKRMLGDRFLENRCLEEFFLIGIHFMQRWRATTRHSVIRKRRRLKANKKSCLERI